jgi:integral membrane protein (TIGR01906 family)
MNAGGPTIGWHKAAARLAAGLLPLALFLTVLRLILSSVFVQLAYRVPGFPDDSYGFSVEDRLHWAELSRSYLLNDAGIAYLGDLTFPDGDPLFNARELQHMEDVKNLAQFAVGLWLGAGALVLILIVGLMAGGRTDLVAFAIHWGGRATLLLIGALGLLALFAYPLVFVGFHRIFFEGDSWLFLYSDTLIRLFPERFWEQVFAVLIGTTILLGSGAWWLGRRLVAGNAAVVSTPKP